MSDEQTVDFSDLHKYPPNDLTCHCGGEWESHSRFLGPPILGIRSERPCPRCGRKDNIQSSRSKPERFTL